jgi:hypothetical protein
VPVNPAHLGVLQIEPTDQCNLACAMCAPHAEGWERIHGVAKGVLDVDLHARIVRTLADEGCRFDHVIYQWLGDPSVHPQLERLIADAGHALTGRVGYLRVDTNGILLGPSRLERLLATRAAEVPLLVVFTLDATTPETYRRVKGRDAYALATRHARHLLALRPRHAPGVHVQFQFVVQDGNAHEAGAFLRYWTDAVRCHGHGHGHAEILFKRLSVGGGAQGQAAADALYERTLARHGITPSEGETLSVRTWEHRPWQRDDSRAAPPATACPGPWMTPVIRHDGVLQACCSDLGGTHALGNLRDAGFLALWNGERARSLRASLLAGERPGACAGCGGIGWYTLPPDATAVVPHA